jgi:hypothetical protein
MKPRVMLKPNKLKGPYQETVCNTVLAQLQAKALGQREAETKAEANQEVDQELFDLEKELVVISERRWRPSARAGGRTGL